MVVHHHFGIFAIRLGEHVTFVFFVDIAVFEELVIGLRLSDEEGIIDEFIIHDQSVLGRMQRIQYVLLELTSLDDTVVKDNLSQVWISLDQHPQRCFWNKGPMIV